MKKFVNLYFILQFFTTVGLVFVYLMYDVPDWIGIILFASALFSMVMIVGMGDVKWHMSHEEMIKAKKDAIIITRNCSELIDEVKKQLFKQNIMTKEEVSKILDKE